MKKVSVLVFLLCALCSQVAFAADFNAPWTWICSNQNVNIYVDSERLSYNPAADTADVWLLTDHPAKCEYDILHVTLSYKDYTATAIYCNVYKYGYDSCIWSGQMDGIATVAPPSSIGEETMKGIAKMVDRDNKLKAYQEQQAKK